MSEHWIVYRDGRMERREVTAREVIELYDDPPRRAPVFDISTEPFMLERRRRVFRAHQFGIPWERPVTYPERIWREDKDFRARWEVGHRMSWLYFEEGMEPMGSSRG